jgi:hypothetical protein
MNLVGDAQILFIAETQLDLCIFLALGMLMPVSAQLNWFLQKPEY